MPTKIQRAKKEKELAKDVSMSAEESESSDEELGEYDSDAEPASDSTDEDFYISELETPLGI